MSILTKKKTRTETENVNHFHIMRVFRISYAILFYFYFNNNQRITIEINRLCAYRIAIFLHHIVNISINKSILYKGLSIGHLDR